MRRLLLYLFIGAIVGLIFGLFWEQMIWIGLIVGSIIGLFFGNSIDGFLGVITLIILALIGTIIGAVSYGIGYCLFNLSPQHPLWIFMLVGACIPILIRLLRSRLQLQREKLA
ncbi:MAG: hypothetical protein WCT08_02855 [Patescibacteria group bacterium]|jgi:hypothetical protein